MKRKHHQQGQENVVHAENVHFNGESHQFVVGEEERQQDCAHEEQGKDSQRHKHISHGGLPTSCCLRPEVVEVRVLHGVGQVGLRDLVCDLSALHSLAVVQNFNLQTV